MYLAFQIKNDATKIPTNDPLATNVVTELENEFVTTDPSALALRAPKMSIHDLALYRTEDDVGWYNNSLVGLLRA